MSGADTRSLKIAIVDDDASVRDALTAFLSLEGHFVSAFMEGQQFLDRAKHLDIDVALLDLLMPGLSGMQVLQQLKSQTRFPIIMMSAHGDISSAVQAVRLGAYDFVEKPVSPSALLEKLFDVVERARIETQGMAIAADLSVLTPREATIAEQLTFGHTNKEIARNLDLSPRTVESHRARIFEKLKVKNVAGLVRLMAAQTG